MKTVIKGGDAIQTYARRDGATAALKKIGVQASDYAMFIFNTTDGRVAATLDKAREFVRARDKQIRLRETPQKQLLGRTAKEAASNQIKRPTVASVCRTMIREGKSNAEIHEVLKRDYGHGESKKGYPGWYRAQMTRFGDLLPAATVASKQVHRPVKRVLAPGLK